MRIFLSCCEASSDSMAGALIPKLIETFGEDTEIFGIAGPEMQRAGMECWYDIEEFNVMGISQVLIEIPRLLSLKNKIAHRLDQNPPDIMLCVDAPDFHIRLKEKLQRPAKFSAQWVSPSVWAWRSGRAKRFAEAFDAIYCIFPFEPEWYANLPTKAKYIGHPSWNKSRSEKNLQSLFQEHFPSERPKICLLPGSRQSELQRLKNDFVQITNRINAQKDVQWILLSFPKWQTWLESWWQEEDNPPTIVTDTALRYATLRHADAALCCSGTVELELSLRLTPHIVLYRFKGLDNFLRKFFTFHVDSLSLSNILLKRKAIAEFVHHDIQHDRIANQLLDLIEDSPQRQQQLQDMEQIDAMLPPPVGHNHFSDAIIAHIKQQF